MIPQRNTIKKIHIKIMWYATPEGQEEVELVTLNTNEGRGGWGCEVREEENKKIFSGGLPY